jgi:broad specificity phosphatase PhoE
MSRPRAIYLTHPEVEIDPEVDVTEWGLNEIGLVRTSRLASAFSRRPNLQIITSGERKAMETGLILSPLTERVIKTCPDMHENDRSATGYLPREEFERTADAFFANPQVSVRGWETAEAAQRRICSAVRREIVEFPEADLLFIGHGGVGTLLYCALAGEPISRVYDQPGNGGSWFAFDPVDWVLDHGWRAMEDMTLN